MTDAELMALTTLLNCDLVYMTAENQLRERLRESPAGSVGPGWEHFDLVVAELQRRKVLATEPVVEVTP